MWLHPPWGEGLLAALLPTLLPAGSCHPATTGWRRITAETPTRTSGARGVTPPTPVSGTRAAASRSARMVSAVCRGHPAPHDPPTLKHTHTHTHPLLLAAVCMTCNGEEYRGAVDHTESGTECQRWDLQHPHKHPYHPNKYRPPAAGSARPSWPCHVPGRWCHLQPLLPISGPGTLTRGWMTTTAATPTARSGRGATPPTPGGSASTAASAAAVSARRCLRAAGTRAPGCHPNPALLSLSTTQAEKRPPRHNITTGCFRGKGEGYRGQVNVTMSGIPCQRWDSQSPHQHHFVPEKYPCK